MSYTEENKEVNYNKTEREVLTETPLTFTVLDDYTYLFWHETQGGTIPFRIYVSVNGGEEYYVDTSSANSGMCIGTFYAGDEIAVRGENEVYVNPSDPSVHAHFLSSGRVSVKGNIMSLIYRNDFEDKTYFPQGTFYSFFGLFEGLNNLVDASELILPATALTVCCYNNMFQGCSSITTAPALPATTLADGCYSNMFGACISLTSAPELPATTLADYCYQNIFTNCTSLTTVPELPATTLAIGCYNYMFAGCTSLTTAPELPATTLAESCYSYMFNACTGLTTAPELPATTLAEYCYQDMFYGCASLTIAPELPATTLASYCYRQMFNRCTSLNYIKCLATNISATNCTYDWVNGVASSGTFVKNPSMTGWGTGLSGIPSGWTVQDAS